MDVEYTDRLLGLQVELVQLALDYVGEEVADVYVYASVEHGSCAYNAFFGVNGRICGVADMPSFGEREVRQRFLSVGSQMLSDYERESAELGVSTPTEMRIHHRPDQGTFDSSLTYLPVHSQSDTLTAGEVFMAWRRDVSDAYQR